MLFHGRISSPGTPRPAQPCPAPAPPSFLQGAVPCLTSITPATHCIVRISSTRIKLTIVLRTIPLQSLLESTTSIIYLRSTVYHIPITIIVVELLSNPRNASDALPMSPNLFLSVFVLFFSQLLLVIFLNWMFIVTLTARSYRDFIVFLFWE